MQKWLFIIQAKNTKVIIYYISINAKGVGIKHGYGWHGYG